MAPPTASSGAFIIPSASSKTRRCHTFSASLRAASSVSSCVTPTSTHGPGPISPMTSPPTRTRASVTRCTSARIRTRRSTARRRLGLFVLLQRAPVSVGVRPDDAAVAHFFHDLLEILQAVVERGVDPVELPAHLAVLVVELLLRFLDGLCHQAARSRSGEYLPKRATLFIFAR